MELVRDFVSNGCGAELPDAISKLCENCAYHQRVGEVTIDTRNTERGPWDMHAVVQRCVTTVSLLPFAYFDNNVRKYGIPAERYEDFWQKLIAQHFRCYYTGVPLVPGVNASIDHRTLIGKGGSRTNIDNCVWCDRQINAFENDLPARNAARLDVEAR